MEILRHDETIHFQVMTPSEIERLEEAGSAIIHLLIVQIITWVVYGEV